MIELIKKSSKTRTNRDRGASAVEYALIMGLIVATLITIMVAFGPAVARQFNRACTAIPGTTC
jgi:Flp pilus assembly pilin Flp